MNFRRLFDYSQPLVAAATLVMVGLVVCAVLAGYTAYQIKVADDTVAVTGSAKEAVTADLARWSIHLEAKTGLNDQQVGYDRLEKASTGIERFLGEQGFDEVEVLAVTSFADTFYPQDAAPVLTGYTVSREIVVRSGEIEKISALTNRIDELTGPGYTVTTGSLELTYSKLDEIRIRLLSKAIEDAKARANAIAQETGRSVGLLRSAEGGVVQVLPLGGIDVSDYGAYDTTSVNKEVMVTVRTRFGLD